MARRESPAAVLPEIKVKGVAGPLRAMATGAPLRAARPLAHWLSALLLSDGSR